MEFLTLDTFFIVLIAGILGTYVMSLTGAWQTGLGLAPLDPAGVMLASLNKAHGENPPYGIVSAHVYHYLNGIALAVIFAAVLKPNLTGLWVLDGLILTVITTLLAAVVVVPLAMGAGIFFSKTGKGALMTASSFAAHAGYSGTVVFTLAMFGQY